MNLDIGPKRLEVRLEDVIACNTTYSWRYIDEKFIPPTNADELEKLKKEIDPKYNVVPEQGYVVVHSIDPLVFGLFWSRSYGERDDGTLEDDAPYCGKLPPRIKVSLSEII